MHQFGILLMAHTNLQAESAFQSELERAHIEVESYIFKTADDVIEHIQDIIVS